MACGTVVFAKAPLSGQAKTRLAGALGADGAARLAERFLRHALAEAQSAALGPVELCITPDEASPWVQALAAQAGVPVVGQGSGDLGQRMARALVRMQARTGQALLLGTDAPALDAARLRGAARALADADAVFVPTHDGGYALVGLAIAPPAALFEDLSWSHAGVMQAARERAATCGLRVIELATVHDIDTPADLVHLPPAWLADTGR